MAEFLTGNWGRETGESAKLQFMRVKNETIHKRERNI